MISILGILAVAAAGFSAAPTTQFAEPAVNLTMAADSEGLAVYRAAKRYAGAKILVSTKDRWLWFVLGKDTLLSAPVAIGMGKNFEYKGKKYRFETPRGRRKVLGKQEKPIWTVPEWHYLEKAAHRGLTPVYVKPGEVYPLDDGTYLEMQNGEVGRVNHFGNFWPFTPGIEIIFDGKIYVPPLDSPQRRVPDALGPVKLDMGDGYLIHGTHEYNEQTIGDAVSHGCVRMRNEDVSRLAVMVDAGTPVFIY
jgi:hypothetical protein